MLTIRRLESTDYPAWDVLLAGSEQRPQKACGTATTRPIR
jgi:hypothetical protein